MPLRSDDDRLIAKARLPRFLFDYLDGGALAETTLEANRRDLAAFEIPQRVLRDVSRVSLEVSLNGAALAIPLALSPVGMAGMYARRGEAQAARAAARAGVPFSLSTVSICDLAEVTQAAGRPPWFQLYVTRDRGFMRAALARARTLGVETLVLTVDMPTPGLRYRDRRTGLSGRPGWRQRLGLYAQAATRPRWCWDVGVRGGPHVFGTVAASAEGDFGVDRFWSWMADNFDPTVSWADLDEIRALWPGTLLVKGVLHPDDARAAVAAGTDGLIVSNHGGRQQDGSISTIHALPTVRAAVGPDVTILVDGGVRSGSDIFRALAAGADAAMIGRPWVYALAAGGEAGVAALLADLGRELEVTMALAGITSISAVRALAHPPPPGARA